MSINLLSDCRTYYAIAAAGTALSLCCVKKNKVIAAIPAIAAAFFAWNAKNFANIPKDLASLYSCNVQLSEAKKFINACPAAANFAAEQQPYTIECRTPEQIHGQGAVRFEKRSILVSDKPLSTNVVNEPMTKTILFELNNLNQSDSFLKVIKEACSDSANNYAWQMENLEFKTTLNTEKIVKECVDLKAWPENWHHNITDTDDDFAWSMYNQITMGHFDFYIQAWHRLCKE